jgi:hypothetical protein
VTRVVVEKRGCARAKLEEGMEGWQRAAVGPAKAACLLAKLNSNAADQPLCHHAALTTDATAAARGSSRPAAGPSLSSMENL